VSAVSIHTESLESGNEDEESREPVPQREGEVDEKLVGQVLGDMVLLDDVVDVRNSRANEQGKDESDDVVSLTPDVDIDGVEEDEEREAPVNAIDDGLLAVLGGLIDDGSEKKEVNDRPDAEHPARWSEVGLLAHTVVRVRSSYGVHSRAEEENVENYVDNFEQNTISPVSHVCVVFESLKVS